MLACHWGLRKCLAAPLANEHADVQSRREVVMNGLTTPNGSGVRIAPWPEDRGNPYQALFYNALAPSAVSVVSGLTINDATLRRLSGEH